MIIHTVDDWLSKWNCQIFWPATSFGKHGFKLRDLGLDTLDGLEVFSAFRNDYSSYNYRFQLLSYRAEVC